MRNNVSPAMQECSALLEFLFLCNHAGFKIVQCTFYGRFCAPRPSPCDACQFCSTILHYKYLEAALFAWELFCSSVEASFFGLVVRPGVDHRGGLFEQQLH